MWWSFSDFARRPEFPYIRFCLHPFCSFAKKQKSATQATPGARISKHAKNKQSKAQTLYFSRGFCKPPTSSGSEPKMQASGFSAQAAAAAGATGTASTAAAVSEGAVPARPACFAKSKPDRFAGPMVVPVAGDARDARRSSQTATDEEAQGPTRGRATEGGGQRPRTERAPRNLTSPGVAKPCRVLGVRF